MLVIVIESGVWKIDHEHEHEHDYEEVEGAESEVIPRLAQRAEGPLTR